MILKEGQLVAFFQISRAKKSMQNEKKSYVWNIPVSNSPQKYPLEEVEG